MPKSYSLKIEKPWGYEIILTPENSPVTGKIAFTKAGHRWSFQYHDQKEETLCLINGEAELWSENENGEIEKFKMEPKKGYLIKPLKKHRFCGITDCLSVEISTKETGTTVRLEDDYRRGNESNKEREKRKEGELYTG